MTPESTGARWAGGWLLGGLDRSTLVVAGVATLGLIMAVLDTTIVNVALDTLSRELRSPLSSIRWVSTGYLLSGSRPRASRMKRRRSTSAFSPPSPALTTRPQRQDPRSAGLGADPPRLGRGRGGGPLLRLRRSLASATPTVLLAPQTSSIAITSGEDEILDRSGQALVLEAVICTRRNRRSDA
jgi:hypothetical protein